MFKLITNDIYYLLQERLLRMNLALMMKDVGMDIVLVLLSDERMWDDRKFNNFFNLDGDLTRRIKPSKVEKDKKTSG
jgi:hypothetical protein